MRYRSAARLVGIARHSGGYYHQGMKTISLKLPDDLLADLEQEAKARRLTKSVLVRQSLESSLRRRPRRVAASCYDLARDLAGSVRRLPPDLAYNPHYMEGFGE
jgi:predicted transcriptional regulator